MNRGRCKKNRGCALSLEALGISKGEQVPPPSLAPPPLFPPLSVNPIPIKPDKTNNYEALFEIKKKLFSNFISSKNFLIRPKVKLTIERYSDKFETNNESSNQDDLNFDERIYPEELRSKKKKEKYVTKELKTEKVDNLLLGLDELNEKDEEMKEENDDDNVEEEEPTEEEIEEETDYAVNYFDNGENYLDDSDDCLDEGPTY